jgi:hypothetical protein
MRKTMLILSLLLANNALAVRLAVDPRTAVEPVDSPRKAKVLRDARAAFTLPDGSQWITHRVPAQREPGAIGVTRFGTDGTARVFLVSDWLPKGSIPRGWCGQVYGVTLLTDGRVAVSAGWTDGRNSHNAIVILSLRGDGRYDTDKVIELPGVAQIAGAPRNTILAVTNDANRRGGGPLLTLFDTEGRKIGAGFSDHLPVSAPEAAQNARKARLHRFGERRFAFYDPYSESVAVIDFEVLERETILTPIQVTFVGDDATTSALPVLDIDQSPDGDILVVRAGVIRGTPGTQLTIYGEGAAKQSVILDRPWNLMLRENDRVRGVVLRGQVALDTVALAREK